MSRKGNIYTVNKFTGTLREIAHHFGIRHNTLLTRLRLGWTLEMAVNTPVINNPSCKLSILEIGDFRGDYISVEKRFGIIVHHKSNSERTLKYLKTHFKPKFYSVGENYKGSLIAISEDFNCPLSLLSDGVKKGVDPQEILKLNGYLEK